jgi:hypothetical protein
MAKKNTKTSDDIDLSFLDEPSTMTPPPEAITPAAPAITPAAPIAVPVAIEPVAPTKPEAVVGIVRQDPPAQAPIRFGARGFEPDTFEAVQRLARFYLAADVLPRTTMAGARDTMAMLARIGIILERGRALGLPAGAALEAITIINGRVCLWGDAMLGLVLSHPDCEGVQCDIEGAGDDRVAVAIAHRRGRKVSRSTFSVADAKRANLWGRAGPWTQYPERMLKARARGFALRDVWADVLTGIKPVEEILDYDDCRDHAAGQAELLDRLRGS